MPYCSRCGKEYREGAASCSGCHTLLSAEQRKPKPKVDQPEPGDPNKDPFFPFWRGLDEQLCSEICLVLKQAAVRYRVLHRDDHLLFLPNQVPHEIGVPGSLFEQAVAAVKEAFGADESGSEDAVPLLPSPYPKYESDPLERDNRDASVEIWSGPGSPLQMAVEDMLRDEKILTRWQWSKGRWYAFVLPEDESRARGLVCRFRDPDTPE